MSETITLTLRRGVDEWLDVDGVTPDRLATLTEREIAALPVWAGKRRASIGDFFTVRGEQSSRVRLEGALTRIHGIGAGMIDGELTVTGSVGDRAGDAMRGGTLTIDGDAGDDAGIAMAGGLLRINGRAGDRLGAAAPGASKGITGGEILVTGSAGAYVAARARRGLVVVGGDTGRDAAHAMIAGTLVVLGRVGAASGRGSKRGTIIAAGGIDVPPTYRYACTYEPPHLRVVMQHLRKRHALTIDDRVVAGRYRRYCGDAGDPGKGEILVRDAIPDRLA